MAGVRSVNELLYEYRNRRDSLHWVASLLCRDQDNLVLWTGFTVHAALRLDACVTPIANLTRGRC
jgi:hypothetical protein